MSTAATTDTDSKDPGMGGYDPAGYGEGHAEVYDRIYRSFPTAAAVTRIGQLAAGRDGPVLDLGIGTGRLALPLRAAGIDVHGLDASPAMIARLRAQPGGAAIPVWQADMATFDLPERYSVVVCAVSTLFMLPDRDTQIACLRRAAHHLTPGGSVVIEAFVPDPSRYDHAGHRVEIRHLDNTRLHLVASGHDPAGQSVHITHVLADEHGVRSYPVTLRYAWPTELDLMASDAQLGLVERTGGWDSQPYTAATTDHVSIYGLADRRAPHTRPG